MFEKDERFATAKLIVCRLSFILFPIFLLYVFHNEFGQKKYTESYAVYTQGCRIHNLDPFNPEVDHLVFDPRYLIKPCENTFSRLLDRNDTHIWIQQNNRKHYKNAACCYQYFYQPKGIKDINSKDVMRRVQYRSCEPFYEFLEVTHEFVRVECEYGWRLTYIEYFIFAPKKTFVKLSSLKNIPQNQSSYNVIVMGLDKISRMNLYRTMPKTVAYLKNMGAVELEGYSKVARSELGNGIPLLIGRNLTELHHICWLGKNSNFDNCPFIWTDFRNAGYYTAFVEDNDLSMFDDVGHGFLQNPTDYYPYIFFTEAQSNIGNSKTNRTAICMGKKSFYRVVLDYIESLTRTLKSSKLFGVFWERSVSYDYAMHPKIMDKKYERFFRSLDSSGYLNNTVLIVLSDRGIPWDAIRTTKQGRLEERRPFAYILVPSSFQNNYKNAFYNLQLNTKRLTTPYDVYATMKDLVDLKSIKDEEIWRRSQTSYGTGKSISLFLPIPENRTCDTVGIEQLSCPCEANKELPPDVAREAALYLVDKINWWLLGYDRCAKLSLNNILEAVELVSESWWNGTIKEVRMVVSTDPGSGEFQSNLRYENGQWSRKGSVIRTNSAGTQGYCINKKDLKPFCYCWYTPPNNYY